jgi:hypothetical protein
MRFVCIQNCFTESLVERGQIAHFENAEAINEAVRPFFRPLKASDKVVKGADNEEQTENEKPLEKMSKAELLIECERVGAAVNSVWPKPKLLIEIKKKIIGF